MTMDGWLSKQHRPQFILAPDESSAVSTYRYLFDDRDVEQDDAMNSYQHDDGWSSNMSHNLVVVILFKYHLVRNFGLACIRAHKNHNVLEKVEVWMEDSFLREDTLSPWLTQDLCLLAKKGLRRGSTRAPSLALHESFIEFISLESLDNHEIYTLLDSIVSHVEWSSTRSGVY